MLNRKVAGMLDRETTVGTGHYSLRLPSYRSSHARRYHPYPVVRRYARNDEFYMVWLATPFFGITLTDLESRRICQRTEFLTSTTKPLNMF